ncbi:hypothetical protein EX30DRAFT_354101 [Ascodesmis nigricans]|uniref:Nudix hydrolase domain-containing protein n=1 Tax=Ascodesmis nigricans TaxID=341454 RepID=A0A4S2N0S6_9PEZI|nr:hypothetical protein EX30DRAFT_354101 [Ascodesmis nigricans]
MSHSNTTKTASNVPITLPPDLSVDKLHSFHPFTSWLSTLESNLNSQRTDSSHPFASDPYSLRSITIQSVDFFGSRIGFLKLKADVRNSQNSHLPGSIFLRGSSVAILLIPELEESPDEKWVMLTVQPRIPAGVIDLVELPAGMMDDQSKTFAGTAAQEIEEECGITIEEDGLVELTALAKGPVYMSPGGCDEVTRIFLCRQKVKSETLKEWQGKLTGLRDRGEKITLKLVKLEDVWRETADAKALAAIALYDGLMKDGKAKL